MSSEIGAFISSPRFDGKCALLFPMPYRKADGASQNFAYYVGNMKFYNIRR